MKFLFLLSLALTLKNESTPDSKIAVTQFMESYLGAIGKTKEDEFKNFFSADYLKRRGPTALQNLLEAKPLSEKEKKVFITDYIEKRSRIFVKWSSDKKSKSADEGLPWYILIKGGKNGWQIDHIDANAEPFSKDK